MNQQSIKKNGTAKKCIVLFAGFASLVGMGITQPAIATPIVNEVSQVNQITGLVLDKNGDPIIGATVQVKGTKQLVVTDLDGKFVIKNAKASTITISYVGFIKKEVQVQPGKSLNITLEEDAKMLNDVVVVGYGTQRKEELTSSVMSVKSDNFLQGENSDAASLIRGKVAGLTVVQSSGNPLSTSEIMLRGITTLKANAAPLVIIDGVPGELNDISPNDIDQIDVLKDGSAADKTYYYG